MKEISFIFVFILTLISIKAQNIRDYDLNMQAKHAQLKGYDTLYRVNYFENIIIKTMFTSNVPRLELINGITENSIEIKPASDFQLGLSMDYKWFAIGFSFTPNFLLNNQNLEELDNSKSFGMSLNFFYSDRWRQELKYSSYEGFFSTSTLNDEELDFELKNMTLKAIEGSTYFIVNRNFSFRSSYAQTERQLKSVGSLIPRIIYIYSVLDSNMEKNLSINEVNEVNSLDIMAQVGYLYTFVYNKKWFATIGVHPGLGYNYSQYEYGNSNSLEKTFNNLTFALESELNIGYNNYRWFFGATYSLKNYNHSNSNKDEFNTNTGAFNIYLGYRFNDNKPMRKFFGWFEDKFGF